MCASYIQYVYNGALLSLSEPLLLFVVHRGSLTETSELSQLLHLKDLLVLFYLSIDHV